MKINIFLGSFIIGLVSDKYGRRKALIVAILLAGGSGAIATFVNNRTLFAILRITVGMGGMGCFMVPAVIAGICNCLVSCTLVYQIRVREFYCPPSPHSRTYSAISYSLHYFQAESTLPDYRLIATMLSGCGFAFGELVLALEAYYLRTW